MGPLVHFSRVGGLGNPFLVIREREVRRPQFFTIWPMSDSGHGQNFKVFVVKWSEILIMVMHIVKNQIFVVNTSYLFHHDRHDHRENFVTNVTMTMAETPVLNHTPVGKVKVLIFVFR